MPLTPAQEAAWAAFDDQIRGIVYRAYAMMRFGDTSLNARLEADEKIGIALRETEMGCKRARELLVETLRAIKKETSVPSGNGTTPALEPLPRKG